MGFGSEGGLPNVRDGGLADIGFTSESGPSQRPRRKESGRRGYGAVDPSPGDDPQGSFVDRMSQHGPSSKPCGNRQTLRRQHQGSTPVRAAWLPEAAAYKQWKHWRGMACLWLGPARSPAPDTRPEAPRFIPWVRSASFWSARTRWTRSWLFRNGFWSRTNERIARALVLLRRARTKLASGSALVYRRSRKPYPGDRHDDTSDRERTG